MDWDWSVFFVAFGLASISFAFGLRFKSVRHNQTVLDLLGQIARLRAKKPQAVFRRDDLTRDEYERGCV